MKIIIYITALICSLLASPALATRNRANIHDQHGAKSHIFS